MFTCGNKECLDTIFCVIYAHIVVVDAKKSQWFLLVSWLMLEINSKQTANFSLKNINKITIK